jgi:hypothetical protein
MLMMRFTLEVFDAIETKDIKNKFPTLGLGIVREETVGCTMVSNEVFKSLGHVRFQTRGIDNGLGTGLANIELSHSSTTMAKNPIIMGWSVTEEGASCYTFIPSMDIVGRETGLEVFSHWEADRGTSILSCRRNGLLDAIHRHPSKEGS